MNFICKYLVYPAGKTCDICFEPVFPVKINDEDDYKISMKPLSGLKLYGIGDRQNTAKLSDAEQFTKKHDLEKTDGKLIMKFAFPQEDRYIVRFYVNDVETDVFELYALEDDLFSRIPYMGDNHLHTWNSDGTDSPQYICAVMCRRGYDYAVITDHHKFEPSLDAKAYFEGTDVDFLIIPGEEVHSPDNPVHIINLGGNKSVNIWHQRSEDEYRKAVEEELKKIDVPMLKEYKYAAAASQVMFDKIKEVQGVSVLCHPGWIVPNGFNMAEDVTDYLIDNKRFDALELIAGGAYEIGTQIQLSYYHDRETMPILGSSDTHSTNGGSLEPGNYTIVFAQCLNADSIKSAIKGGYTVAGNENKLYGSYRLVKYAYFLMKNYYPEHHKQRNTLGAWMMRFASCGLGLNSVQAQNLKSPKPSKLFETIRYKD